MPQRSKINIKMKTKQAEIPSRNWLYARGYTLRQAARAVHCTPGHLSRVISGERESSTLGAKLRALPKRALNMRERVTAACAQ